MGELEGVSSGGGDTIIGPIRCSRGRSDTIGIFEYPLTLTLPLSNVSLDTTITDPLTTWFY